MTQKRRLLSNLTLTIGLVSLNQAPVVVGDATRPPFWPNNRLRLCMVRGGANDDSFLQGFHREIHSYADESRDEIRERFRRMQQDLLRAREEHEQSSKKLPASTPPATGRGGGYVGVSSKSITTKKTSVVKLKGSAKEHPEDEFLDENQDAGLRRRETHKQELSADDESPQQDSSIDMNLHDDADDVVGGSSPPTDPKETRHTVPALDNDDYTVDEATEDDDDGYDEMEEWHGDDVNVYQPADASVVEPEKQVLFSIRVEISENNRQALLKWTGTLSVVLLNFVLILFLTRVLVRMLGMTA